MREIKFRAWHKEKKKMLSYGELFNIDCSGEYPFLALAAGHYEDCIEPLKVELMQYTGLQDTNGVDIYEGDIVKIPCYMFSSKLAYYTNKEVYFAYGMFGVYGNPNIKYYEGFRELFTTFKGDEQSYISNFGEVYNKRISLVEIIGNIYENPELLEV